MSIIVTYKCFLSRNCKEEGEKTTCTKIFGRDFDYVFDGNVDVAFGCLAWHFIVVALVSISVLCLDQGNTAKKWQKMDDQIYRIFLLVCKFSIR